MKNITTINVHIESFESISHIKTDEFDFTSLTTGSAALLFDEKPIEIKVGDNRVKVTTLEFMQAVKDMLDSGTFELDQIDSEVWDIEKKLEVIGNQNDYLNETLREIRGGC